jgi:hypothetical protein
MRTRSEERRDDLNRLVSEAVARGIIDGGQREKLQALAVEVLPEASDAAERASEGPSRREARRGFNAITIAYSLGALLVLFALAWFLFDRWQSLGPGGVLGVSLLYAASFAACGVLLRRRGFEVAGGLAIVLAIAMTPVWIWAVLRLTGELPDPSAWDNALSRYEPYIATRLIVAELATIGVALIALRRIRFFVLGAPIAAGFIALLMSLGQALGDPRLSWYVGPYYQCMVGCATLAVAYAVERRQPPGEDYAFWFYLGGAGTLLVGYVLVWSSIGVWRHALPFVAALLVAASLYLRRRVLLIAGGLAMFAYVGYLAFDVFRRVVALPVALATLGLLVIVTTVWMQRRFPALVARVSQDVDGERRLPGGALAVLGPLFIAIVVVGFAGVEAKERTQERDWRTAYYQRRSRNQLKVARRAKAAADSAARQVPDSTPAAPRK